MYPSVIPENDLVPHGNQNQLPCFARHGPQQIQTLYYRVMAWPAFSLGMTYPFGGEPVISPAAASVALFCPSRTTTDWWPAFSLGMKNPFGKLVIAKNASQTFCLRFNQSTTPAMIPRWGQSVRTKLRSSVTSVLAKIVMRRGPTSAHEGGKEGFRVVFAVILAA